MCNEMLLKQFSLMNAPNGKLDKTVHTNLVSINSVIKFSVTNNKTSRW